MKYFIIPIIALGLGLSLIFGIEYSCISSGGGEMLPKYYGHPFVFKFESLATSLEYHVNLIGVILNTAFWSVFVMLLRFFILKLIKRSKNNRILMTSYKVLIGLCLFATILILLVTMIQMDGFDNIDFYWSMTKEAKEWGCICHGKLMILK